MIILVLLPYSTILSGFSPYMTEHTFVDFLLASLVFAIVSLLLGWIVSGKDFLKNKGLLFFMLGMIVAPPLMLGPPQENPQLLERTLEEHFRYGLLILATFVFAAGFLLLIRKLWNSLSKFDKLIIIPFSVSVILMLWDNYSSFQFSDELKNWIASGNGAEDFFPNHNFHHFYRTLGRTLLYVVITWLSFILLKKQLIEKWHVVSLSVFCAIGLIFFILCNFVGLQFYFPFMVPAVTMAPVYWLGLILIVQKPRSS